MCAFGYFATTQNIKSINLVSSKNAQKYYIEKNAIREKLESQLKHVSGTELHTPGNKVYDLLLMRIRSNKMKVEDFLIVRGQQLFEEGKEINPIEIKIEDNRVQSLFEKYNNYKVKFKLIDLLLVSSIVNNTEKILLQTTGCQSQQSMHF